MKILEELTAVGYIARCSYRCRSGKNTSILYYCQIKMLLARKVIFIPIRFLVRYVSFVNVKCKFRLRYFNAK